MDPRGVPEIPGYENIHMQELQPHTKAHASYRFFGGLDYTFTQKKYFIAEKVSALRSLKNGFFLKLQKFSLYPVILVSSNLRNRFHCSEICLK